MTKLQFVVKTGLCSEAGLHADIWLKLIEWSGRESQEMLIHEAGGDGFFPGAVDTVKFDLPGDFGPIAEIEVRKEDVPGAPSWFLESIRAIDLDTGTECLVTFGDALSSGKWFSPRNGLLHRRHVPSAEVFWCARDLSVYPADNHHFLAVMFRSRDAASWTSARYLTGNFRGDEYYFVTLGGYADGTGKMISCKFNQDDDADTFRAYLNAGKFLGSWNDMDYEKHLIEPLDGESEQALAEAVILAGRNFMMHGHRPTACLTAGNCAVFVNSLLASIGYPADYRMQKGTFWVDSNQGMLFDKSFFHLPVDR